MSDENQNADDDDDTGSVTGGDGDSDKNKQDKNKSGDNNGGDKDGDDKSGKDDLAPLKEKIDKAYKERDDTKKELKELKDKLRQQEIDHLKEQGKEVEALQKQISQKDERIEELEAEVTRLSRDNTVDREFRGYQFRNERAAALAVDTVTKDLVKNDKGEWVHKSGKSIPEYVKSFSEDDDNQFLFAPKTNRGTGTGSKTNSQGGSGDKGDKGNKDSGSSGGREDSLFNRSQADVLKDIAAGKIKGPGQG
jgi:cell division protein FtsL